MKRERERKKEPLTYKAKNKLNKASKNRNSNAGLNYFASFLFLVRLEILNADAFFPQFSSSVSLYLSSLQYSRYFLTSLLCTLPIDNFNERLSDGVFCNFTPASDSL